MRKLPRVGRADTWMLVGLLIAGLMVVECLVVHSVVATEFLGASDFYSRWYGARVLLQDGRDPYSPEVTREIQPVIGVDPQLEGKGGYAYPLYVVFVFLPLAYLPYNWAQAIWMVTVQWVAIAVVATLISLEKWNLSPFGLAALLLGALLLYPVTRTILLGQFTLHVALFLALALLALRSGRDGWAGASLAITSIKPQLVILVGPWMVLWAITQRRWRFLAGLAGGGVVLLMGSIALFPRWPFSFLEDVRRYSQVAGGRNPIAVLLNLMRPGGLGAARYCVAALLVLAMLASWWRSRQQTDTEFQQSINWTIIVSLLVTFQTGTTNQVLLLIPLVAWLHHATERLGRFWTLAAACVLEATLWILFLGTIHGDWEDPVMFLPLPLFGLAILATLEIKSRFTGQQSTRSPVSTKAE